MKLARENIFLLYNDGVSQVEIARTAGVSKQRINQVVTSFKRELARRQHLESLRKFEANREASRRIVKTVREDRAARERDREIRMAYLEAHPRASRTLDSGAAVSEHAHSGAGGSR